MTDKIARLCHTLFALALRVIICAIAGVSLFSWIGSIYGLPVHNVLSIDGVRWVLRHAVPAFIDSPLGSLLTLFFALGLAGYSGLFTALRRLLTLRRGHPLAECLSLRQRRALVLSLSVAVLYTLLLLIGIWGPQGILLGVTGTLAHSPFTEGLVVLLSLGLGLTALIYGFFSGRLSHRGSLMQGLCHYLPALAPLLVLLFFGSLLFALCDYTGVFL